MTSKDAENSLYEELIEKVAGTGKYQNLLIFLGVLANLTVSFYHLGAVFLLELPSSRCNIELEGNISMTDQFITNTFIPVNNASGKFDRCRQYKFDFSPCQQNLSLDCIVGVTQATDKRETIPCENGFHYDRSELKETMTTQWNLVCDDLYKMTLTSTAFYLGVAFGASLGGMLSDRFGRIMVCKFSSLLSFIFALSLAFSPNFYWAMFLRFMLALTVIPVQVSAFVYVTEISKASLRHYMAPIYGYSFSIGCIIMSGLAFFWPHWKTMEISFSVFTIPVVLCMFLVLPKSPRWLLSKGKTEEARQICRLMALRNNTSLPEGIVERVQRQTNFKEPTASIRELLKHPLTRFILICNTMVWASCSLLYFGLSLNGGGLAGNIFVNHALGGAVELVACFLSSWLLIKFGRRNVVVASLTLSAVSCLLSTAVIQLGGGSKILEHIGVVLAMVGRFGSSITFVAIYQQTAELFPTSGRASSLGVSSTAARIGSLLSPFLIQLQFYVPWLMQTILGVVALGAALIATIFPETKDEPLLATFQEAEDFFERHLEGSMAAKLLGLQTNRNSSRNATPLMETHI